MPQKSVGRRGIWLPAAGVAAAILVVVGAGRLRAQTSGAAEGIVQVVANINSRQQIVYHVDAAKQKLLVYQLNGSENPPRFKLLAARDVRYDFQVDDYNNSGPHYWEIRNMVIEQEERERRERELREKKGVPPPRPDDLPPPPAVPTFNSGGQFIAVVGNIRENEQILYLTHTGQRRICVYWFHTSNGMLEFIAGRNIEWDPELRFLHGVGPTPDDIRIQIERERAAQRERQKGPGKAAP